MKLWLCLSLGLLSFAAGIIVGVVKFLGALASLAREARRIERRKEYLRRIHRDYPDSTGG